MHFEVHSSNLQDAQKVAIPQLSVQKRMYNEKRYSIQYTK